MHNPNRFRILHWNANGITLEINELHTLLINLNVDIALICETRLAPMKPLKLLNYHTYRTDNPVPRRGLLHGGTAVLVHRRIVHSPINLQLGTIDISLKNRSLRVSAIYNFIRVPAITLT